MGDSVQRWKKSLRRPEPAKDTPAKQSLNHFVEVIRRQADQIRQLTVETDSLRAAASCRAAEWHQLEGRVGQLGEEAARERGRAEGAREQLERVEGRLREVEEPERLAGLELRVAQLVAENRLLQASVQDLTSERYSCPASCRFDPDTSYYPFIRAHSGDPTVRQC
jgi:hypothetical protein